MSLLEKAKSFGSKDYMAQKEDLLAMSIYKGKIHGLLEDYKTSEDNYRKAIELSKELGTSQLVYTAEIKKGLGEALNLQGKKVDAKVELTESKKMYDKARAAHQAMKAPLTRPSFTNKSVEELLDLVEA